MADLYLTKVLSAFQPADEASAEIMRRFKAGETYRAKVHKPRNPRVHRRYWALVGLIHSNTDQFASMDQVHQYLKLRAGHADQIVSKVTGEVFLVPKSISFDTLDELEFQPIYQKMLDVVAQDILPGINEDALAYEVEKLCGLAA